MKASRKDPLERNKIEGAILQSGAHSSKETPEPCQRESTTCKRVTKN